MVLVEFEEGAQSIDAAVIGRGLNVEPSLVQLRMREGKITVLCERVVEAEVDEHGEVRLRRVTSAVDTGIAVNPDFIVVGLR